MLHIHCESCFKPTNCKSINNQLNGISCPLIKCDNNYCSVVMHKCKLSEHHLICQYEKVWPKKLFTN